MNLGCDATHFRMRTGRVPYYPSARLLDQSVTTFVRWLVRVFGHSIWGQFRWRTLLVKYDFLIGGVSKKY